MAGSGFDPASVITTCRQRQQQHSHSSAPSNNAPQPAPKVSSVLPSGLVAGNECAHLSATLEHSDDHYNANHSHLARTGASNMIRHHSTPGDSDTRHSIPKPHSQWCTHYVNAKSAINHNNSSQWIQDPNRPHLNVILDKKHKVKALIDSGSTICLNTKSHSEQIRNRTRYFGDKLP